MTSFPAPQSYDYLLSGARVVTIAAQALGALAAAMPADFGLVVQAILATKGRVIVCGIGKSGHIGRKIAATFASTGTPAFFVHAAEASHGDLGMSSPDEFCVFLSNSGETPELRDVVLHVLRFGVPFAAISGVQDSTLMRAAQFQLLLPDQPEACSMGMVPTTSTTMMLALGDALAVALMEARRFAPEQFRDYHPGGKLGAALTTLAQIIYKAEKIPLVTHNAPMPDVLLCMTNMGFGIAGVLDDHGRLTGVISDGDLRRNMAGLMQCNALDVATRSPVVAAPDMLAGEALALMNKAEIGAIFICQDQKPIGILHVHDLLRIGVM